MTGKALEKWRTAERKRLLAERDSLDAATLEAWRRRIDVRLEQAFPQLALGTLALCWPIRNEYDARHLARRLRTRGALTCLPVVVAPGRPLVFREWHPGVRLARGALGIPYPADSREMRPDAILVPMNGWDASGHRLGYGGGFFDRTLAALEPRPLVIGISYEFARLETIFPQAWDVPVDYVATEARLLERRSDGLAALPVPAANPARRQIE